MNEQTPITNNLETPNVTPTPTPAPTAAPTPVEKPKKHEGYWGILLVIMVLFLAYGIYLAYKKTQLTPVVSTEPDMTQTVETTTTMPVEDDSAKEPSTVNDEILRDIDEIENTDMSTPLNETQLDELAE